MTDILDASSFSCGRLAYREGHVKGLPFCAIFGHRNPHPVFVSLRWIFYSKDTDLEGLTMPRRSCSLLVAIEAAHRDEASARPRLQAGGGTHRAVPAADAREAVARDVHPWSVAGLGDLGFDPCRSGRPAQEHLRAEPGHTGAVDTDANPDSGRSRGCYSCSGTEGNSGHNNP